MRRTSTVIIIMSSLAVHLSGGEISADTVVHWSFSRGLQGWKGNHHVEDLAWSRDGLSFRSTGIDPWIEGPRIDLPGDRLTKVTVRMKSDANSSGELFYGPYFQAGHSVPFAVQSDNDWHDYELMIMEFLGPGTRFRLDPATTAGNVGVAFIKVETLSVHEAPPYRAPSRPTVGRGRAADVEAGLLKLKYFGNGIGDFVVEVAGQEMAAAYDRELIGVLFEDAFEWLDLKNAYVTATRTEDGLDLLARITDQAGAAWQVGRKIYPEVAGDALVVDVRIQVDADRDVVCLPWLTIFPGLGTFGSHKDEGLLAGLEYLGDEPSSSEADITTPEHIRRVADPVKVTFPLMGIAADGRYVGLVWERSEWIGPMFDSPDTIFNSGAHVMGLTGPAVGKCRFENYLVAHTPVRLTANVPVTARIWIIGGEGATVVPAVQHYVNLRGLPAVPQFEGGFQAAARLLAQGWLYSGIREGALFRHAVWGDHFGPGPAPDAAMFMDWLSASLDDADTELIDALSATRDLALEAVPDSRHLDGGVSHVRPPAAPLVFGDLAAYVERRHNAARSALANFDARGVKTYTPGDIDYGRTHFADHANGYSAQDLITILEGATLSADAELIGAAIELLDKQTLRYADTVPRGAQTWEVPLHTPDILASGLLVKAYTLGYIVSGREDYLEQARYWAWTGVPFAYLVNPTEGRIGPYATIPVFGATNWVGSWFGRPVQWCGLAYASALHLLSEYDPQGPWRRIARGITAAGLEMAWPMEDADRQGLLPDFFLLESQLRDGPAINPGTTQAHVPELFDAGKIYDVERLPGHGCFVHAPCEIRDIVETDDLISFTLDGWGANPNSQSYCVLVSGWTGPKPDVTACEAEEGSDLAPGCEPAPATFLPRPRLLIIDMHGAARLHISRWTQ